MILSLIIRTAPPLQQDCAAKPLQPLFFKDYIGVSNNKEISMPKKNDSNPQPMSRSGEQSFPYVMNGSTVPIQVQAVYKVPSIHPITDGPWKNEVDKIAWVDPDSGYQCICRRNARGGYLEGYVGVDPSHPLFGRETGTLHGYGIKVHEGLSYSETCEIDQPEALSICHVQHLGLAKGPSRDGPQFGRSLVLHEQAWWFGFSCNGERDVIPIDKPIQRQEFIAGVNFVNYKDEHFVRQECTRLAAQLKAIEEGRDPREVDPGGPRRAFSRRGREG